MRDEIILTGHSNVLALGAPTQKSEARQFETVAEVGGKTFIAIIEPYTGRRAPEYWAFAAEACRDRTVLICWNGNQLNATFLIEVSPPADLIIDADEVAGEGRQVIPASVIRAFVKNSLAQLPVVIRQMQDAGAARVVVVGTPAAKDNPERLAGIIRTSASFIKRAADLGMTPEQITVSPTRLRRNLWRILQQETCRVAEAAGAMFVPSPPQSMTAEGYLDPIYAAPDSTHGNAEYGALMRAHLAAIL